MGGKVVLSLPRKIHYSGWKFWVRILPQSRALRPNRAGLPVNFGRGVARAVYRLVSQSRPGAEHNTTRYQVSRYCLFFSEISLTGRVSTIRPRNPSTCGISIARTKATAPDNEKSPDSSTDKTLVVNIGHHHTHASSHRDLSNHPSSS